MTKQLNILFIIIILTLTGCAPRLSVVDHKLPPCKKSIKIEQVDNWALSGKIAGRNNEGSWVSSFNWIKNKDQTDIKLVPTMSTYQIKIAKKGNHATITLPKQTIKTDNIDQAIKEHLNWRMPINNLHYWLKGLPAPNSPKKIAKDDKGRIKYIYQDGWKVTYKAYHDYKYISLPKKLFLTHKPFNVRIIIQQWANLDGCNPCPE